MPPPHVCVPFTRTRPRGACTGYSNPRCFAAELNDCTDALEREHYISKKLLDTLGEQFFVTSPIPNFENKPLRSPSLTKKMLCSRHNRALSPLDDMAGALLGCLKNFPEKLAAGSSHDAFNGFDFERWLLKVLCGFTCLHDEPVPLLWNRILFGLNDIIAPNGLNMNVRLGRCERPSEIIYETARDPTTHVRSGCAVTLMGMQFLLAVHGRHLFSLADLGKTPLRRPRYITWKHRDSGASYSIVFCWGLAKFTGGIEATWPSEDASEHS